MTYYHSNIKIVISVFISVCLIFLFSVTTIAEEYTIREIGSRLHIPDDWYTFSRDSAKSDYPSLDEDIFDACMGTFDISQECILYSISPEFDSEIIITYTKNTDGYIFNSISDKYFEDNLDVFRQGFIDDGFNSVSCSLFHGTNTKYIKLLYSYPDNDIYSLQYSTSNTKSYINITFNSHYDKISYSDDKIATSVANSLTGLSDDLFEVKSTSNKSAPDLNSIFSKIIIAAIVGGIYGAISKIRNSSKSKNENVEMHEEVQELTNIENKCDEEKCKDKFCRICGEKLSDDCTFCPKCGTKV